MEILNAAAWRRSRVTLRQDGPPNQRTPGAHNLRDGALEIRPAHAIGPLERAQNSIAIRVGVCRRDADDSPPGDDENYTEVSQVGNAATDDLPNCPSCGFRGGGRNRKS
jgi:hypothetical protein